MRTKKEERIVYIDGVDFQHELGAAMGGNTVYPDLEDALENNPCAQSCGIVKCKVTLIEWAMPQDWKKASYVTMSPEDLKKNPDLQRLETNRAHLDYLNEKVKKQKKKIKQLEEKLKNK